KGGGGGDTTSTVYQSNLPEYAKPYYEDLMRRGMAESTRPYQTYGGQRLAPQSAQTLGGLNMATQFAQSGSPDLNNARSLAGVVGSQAIDASNYRAGTVDNTYLGPEYYDVGQFSGGVFGADARDEYMSPYMESVIQSSQAEAARNAAIEQAQIKAQQATTGAFGGSRGAVQQQMAASDAQTRIADIGIQGRQSAFENAQQQFERDRQARMEAEQQEEQSRQFGYGTMEQARQRAAELGMSAQQATEELRQGGENIGLQGLQIAGSTAGQLAGFQSQSDQMMMDRFKTMLGVGQTQDDYAQRQRDIAYEDFLNQSNFPRQNLQFLSSLLQGVPISANQNVTQTTPSNPIAGAAGTALGLDALYKLGRGTG
ncbi:MAG TPA: hypothetical protein VFZ07_10255, partial [Dongiaceae bacterium]